MKTLFLHPPSFAGFDGGAGSRYQARREIRSFWYPMWLAQPAALKEMNPRLLVGVVGAHVAVEPYFRPRKMLSMVSELACSPRTMRRRLREGVEFARFLGARRTDHGASGAGASDRLHPPRDAP